MKYKVLAHDDSLDLALVLQNDSVLHQLFGDEPVSTLLRKALQKSLDAKTFELKACSSDSPNGLKTRITTRVDYFTFYGFVGVFSESAAELIVSFGVDRSDFVACHIRQLPEQAFFFFLPRRNYDVLDTKKSAFRSVTPASPPDYEEDIMSGIEKLVLRPSKVDLPACFLLKYPSSKKIEFPEIIVSLPLSQAWLRQGMTGARFF